jgi:hypothetical protein
MNRKKVIITFCIVVAILFGVKFLHPTLVVDADTGKPINGAEVKLEVSNFATGCGNPKTVVTNGTGVALYPAVLLFPCRVSAWADGYHANGVNRYSESKSFISSKIILYKTGETVVPIKMHIFTLEGQGVDVLSRIKLDNPNQENLYGKDSVGDADFSFSKIENLGKNSNTDGPYLAKITFLGEGGIQQISNDSAPGHDSSANYFDMENLLVAPSNGYQKEINIEPGKSYVAKLRDGIHYMKFHSFISERFEGNKEPYICMSAYISPTPGPNINFNFIYEGGIFCSENNQAMWKTLTNYHHMDSWYVKAYPNDESWKQTMPQ